tara:strand:- start:1935 stop:2792 length:858 start_codon:yes stop_codon:yes gene_type:complete
MKKINKTLLELYDDRYQLLVVSIIGLLSAIEIYYTTSNVDIYHASVAWVAVGTLAVASVYSAYQGGKAADQAAAAAAANNQLAAYVAGENLKFQKEQQKKLDKQKEVYRQFEFKNPYDNLENVFEDLTVNQQQAEFEAQQGAQQRADILGQFRGAAGGSGIAGLAQSLANQGQVQARQISASIGMQEQQNKMLASKAESANQMAERGGDAMVQQAEMDRQATLLGIEMGGAAGANAALQQAYSNQIASGAAQANMYGQQAAALYGAAGDLMGTAGDVAGMKLKYS